jgi:DNA modification methylase
MQLLKKKIADNVLPFEKPSSVSIECMDYLQFMRSLPDESTHLIVTSPP